MNVKEAKRLLRKEYKRRGYDPGMANVHGCLIALDLRDGRSIEEMVDLQLNPPKPRQLNPGAFRFIDALNR